MTRWQVHQRDYMDKLLDDFFLSLDEQRKAPIMNQLPPYFIRHLERFLELMVDLLSQRPLRLNFRPLFLDKFFTLRVRDFIEAMRAKYKERREMNKQERQAKWAEHQAKWAKRQWTQPGQKKGGGKMSNRMWPKNNPKTWDASWWGNAPATGSSNQKPDDDTAALMEILEGGQTMFTTEDYHVEVFDGDFDENGDPIMDVDEILLPPGEFTPANNIMNTSAIAVSPAKDGGDGAGNADRSAFGDGKMVFANSGETLKRVDMFRLSEQLLDIIDFYDEAEVDYRGRKLSRKEVLQTYYDGHNQLRKIAYQIPELRDTLALAHVGQLQTRADLKKHFSKIPYGILRKISQELCLLDVQHEPVLKKLDDAIIMAMSTSSEVSPGKKSKKHKPQKTREEHILRKVLLEVIYRKLEFRPSQLDQVNDLPLFPTEQVIWDEHLVPDDHYQNEYSLALPKLNLQFLTIYDYLLKNFHLFRLESTNSIRGDIRDVVPRMRPMLHARSGETRFMGTARMGLPIQAFGFTEVKEPLVGETRPKEVCCEIKFSLQNVRQDVVRKEWSTLREHDVVFLIAISPPAEQFQGNPQELPTREFPERFGIRQIRAAEVHSLLDSEGTNVSDPMEKRAAKGDEFTIKALYDPAQYIVDMKDEGLDWNDSSRPVFHIVMRRSPKENNFKAVLETIRTLMNNSEESVVPKWLHNLFLG